jgi:hypothetical protein
VILLAAHGAGPPAFAVAAPGAGFGQAILTPLDNDYVRVTRNAAPCASASPSICGARVLVALGPIEIVEDFHPRRMQRGEVAVFRWFESYTPPATGAFVEVTIKQDHPPVDAPAIRIPPGKNALLFDGETFFVFEERLEPGDTRARHSHSQRVVIVLNDTRLQQWPDGQPEVFRTEVADEVRFNAAVTHAVKTIGDKPLRNIVIELKP